MSSRNVFENNDPVPDEEDIKAVGDGPHIMLPPLSEGHRYSITKLPSGRSAVVVEEDHPENSEFDRAFPEQNCTCGPNEKCSQCPPLKHDRFGRKYI